MFTEIFQGLAFQGDKQRDTMSQQPAITPYLQIARFDHWFKNVFMLPGVVFAYYVQPDLFCGLSMLHIMIGLLAAGFVASSNYVINELLDAPYDALHPVKKFRPIPSGGINTSLVYIEWIGLALIGLLLAASLGMQFFLVAFWLWVMGCLYNIPPFRSKDKPFIDVLSESVNNPIRLLLGWYATGILVLPPVSLLLAYWMIGAFFMAIKRFAEYRKIADAETAANYRCSFRYYNEERLLISIMYYAVAFGLFFGIFLMRYKMELVLSAPLIAGFMAWYLHLGFIENSPAQYPERLYKERAFNLYCVFCSLSLLLLLYVDWPFLHFFFHSTLSLLPQ